MSGHRRLKPITMLTLGSLMLASPLAAAQTQRDAPAPTVSDQLGNDDADTADTFPVLAVTSVEVLRSDHAPVTDVVLVHGLTSAEGWSEAQLIPLTRGGSSDVLDLVLVAQAPQETAAPTHYEPTKAILPISPEHPYKAIRVRSATNSVMVKSFPGYAEAKAPPEPCSPCVGKLLLAKGAAMPNGVNAVDVVREDDLPPTARVVRPNDGIADMRPNPNRLTLVIGEDGRITDAEWE